MEESRKMIKKILGKMDRQKWLVCILLGVLLLVIAIPVDTEEKEEEEATEIKEEETGGTKEMERELECLLESIEGVGEVQVMITLEDEGERVVAQDVSSTNSSTTAGSGEEKKESQTERTTVFSEDVPYETKKIQPKIRGVCVVAQGVSKDEVRVSVYQAIQALFSVDAHKISIVEMGSQEGI